MGGYGHRIRVLGAERQRRAGRLRLGRRRRTGRTTTTSTSPARRSRSGSTTRWHRRASSAATGGQTARGAVDRQRARRTDRRATRDRRGPPGLWEPGPLANFIATSDRISNGRFSINIVSGWFKGEFTGFGQPWLEHDERYARSSEFIEVLKALWTEERATYDGRFYTIGKDIEGSRARRWSPNRCRIRTHRCSKAGTRRRLGRWPRNTRMCSSSTAGASKRSAPSSTTSRSTPRSLARSRRGSPRTRSSSSATPSRRPRRSWRGSSRTPPTRRSTRSKTR